MSHPTWVCGLKRPGANIYRNDYGVTPYVGVWIETNHIAASTADSLSHPTWVCGLKLSLMDESITSTGHTLRGCVD